MEKTKRFFKDTAFYLTSNVVSNSLNFITGIVVRRFLAPAMMGFYNGILLVFDYARHSHLGIIDAMDRELPVFYGKKDYRRLERIRDVGFSACLLVSLLIACGVFAASFIAAFDSRLLRTGMRIVAAMVIARFLNSLYIVMNRSRNRFSVISKYTILYAAFDVLLKILLVMKFGIHGLLWASVLTLVFGAFYFYKASGERFRFVLDFSFKEIFSMLKIGFPIFVMGFVFITLRNIDRIMIIRLMDAEALGFYTIALMLAVYMLQLPSLVYAVFFPRFYQAYGEKQDIREIKRLFIKPTVIFACLLPVFVGCCVILLPLLLKYALPAYMPGFLPSCILLFGCCFIGLTYMPQYLLTVLNKQIYLVAIGIASIAAAVWLNWMLVKGFGMGLGGIALGTSLAYFCYSAVLTICAFSNYTKQIVPHLKFLAGLYLPFLWVIGAVLLLKGMEFNSSGSFAKDMSVIFYKELAFLAGCLPLFFYANRRAGILELVRKML